MKRFLLPIAVIIFTSSLISAQSLEINGNWLFKTGDSAAWSGMAYSDAHWTACNLGKTWEEQSAKGYDGIAWYRKTLVLPAAFKKLNKEQLKAGFLTLELGKIDDADETFVNGVLIGATGKFPPKSVTAWDEDRSYKVPLSALKWNAPNVIAVRVADWGGGGGLYSGNYVLEAAGWKKQLTASVTNNAMNHSFKAGAPVTISFKANNQSAEKQPGVLACTITTFTDSFINKQEKSALLQKGNTTVPFNFPSLPPGFYKTLFTFTKKDGSLITKKHGFAVAPEQATVRPDAQPDFDAFWTKARTELNAVPPNFKMTKQEGLLDDNKFDTWLVEMTSLGNVRVRGWYVTPKGKKNLPAVLNVPGYSSEMKPWQGLDDAAIFHFNIRGHGNSKDDVNPGFPGYILTHIDDKEKYIYRGAFMDCIRAVDFLCSRPEIDTSRIGVMGTSQGGALSFATAALDRRIKCSAPDVPFLSDYPNYFKIAYWPGNEFIEYVAKNNGNWNDIYTTLSYFDIKNLAVKIECPLLMGVGLQDNVCPPAINFAAYNNVTGVEKQYFIYPEAGHGLPAEQMDIRLKWLAAQLSKK
jgi:cephalosporin-C deacetylase